MSHELESFSHEQFGDIRSVVLDGEPWFVAIDVCRALGLANVGEALRGLDEDERNSIRIADGNRGNPNLALVSEAGLYSLILRSRKPEARRFKRWVTHDVLPAIRKTGRYLHAVPDIRDPDQAAEVAELMLKAYEDTKRAKLELECEVRELEAQQEVLAPKAEVYDAWLEKAGPVNIRTAARMLKQVERIHISEKVLAERLREWRLIEKYGTAATAYAIDNGWMTNRGGANYGKPWVQGRFTRKGIDYLVKKILGGGDARRSA